MRKRAKTTVPIFDLLAERWSPRAFLEKPVEKEKLQKIFEAARWSASCFNEQPWRFIVGEKEQGQVFDKLYETLSENNKLWCRAVPVLVSVIGRTAFSHNDQPNKWYQYDLGQSAVHITVQAMAEGLHVHQMAGFDKEKVRKAFGIPENFDPLTMIAIGYIGDPETLPEKFKTTELSERSRKNPENIVYSGRAGEDIRNLF